MREIEVGAWVERWLSGQTAVIDVRSESEYLESSIPGSVNIPLFSDAERSEIGILYKQAGQEAAKDRGLDIVAAKMPTFVRALRAIEGTKSIFCWRGGMRSRTAATLLSLLDRDVYQIKGGYRAFRNWVVETLRDYRLPAPLVVLNGMTGSGKTALLRQLQASGEPVLDLERLAGHRGSIFGGIGLAPTNQRTFEAELLLELERIRLRIASGAAAKSGVTPYILMEGESPRIGKVWLPEFLLAAKQEALELVIELPAERRIENILQDYNPETDHEAFLQAFARIEKRIHTPVAKEIRQALLASDFPAAVALLLEHYYDSRYRHSMEAQQKTAITIHSQTNEQSLAGVKAYLQSQFARG